jgi:hypothetical protein
MYQIISNSEHEPMVNMDFILEEAYEKPFKPFYGVMDEF